MNLDFLFSPPILLVLSACLAMLLFCLFNFLVSFNLTRPVVFMLGLCFIGVGVFGHIAFLDVLERCRELQSSGNVSQDVLSRLERYHLVFAYMLPFVSGAIGTNVISDALLKHHTYERPFRTLQFLQDLAQVFLMPIGLVIGIVVSIFWLVLLPIAPARHLLRSMLPKTWRWIFLRIFKLSIITRNNIRSVRGSLKPAPDDTP
ncbi:hypothetical protein [Pseudomonas inefficax]|uniref:hypothetical protein n=1 Tax=Pseudomonas inefficax TaxID=2078786 RepID=UPI002DBE47B5|nr:hypothetical protein [Pseudomonas sp. CMAA1741]MEC4560634.1 hypothetical protein [Pseudomonas sp. CMAA1741]